MIYKLWQFETRPAALHLEGRRRAHPALRPLRDQADRQAHRHLERANGQMFLQVPPGRSGSRSD